ncbi:hypothetical protein Btru_058855 [Bulinus truncatus]|nr:hypothetical protein Btru_058855 [Bulinus truncatus]
MDLPADSNISQSFILLRDALETKDSLSALIYLNHLLECGQNSAQELHLFKENLRQNVDLIFKMCKLELIDPLEKVLKLQVIDINYQYNGKTLLQLACKKGYSNIVPSLIEHGATVKPEVWAEDSEFFLASYYGHLNVINILLNKFHSLVQEMSIAYCLFYAACCSGKLSVVQKWFSPNMNLNNAIEFVPTLHDCEQSYPLFAVCKAKHIDIACFLIENGASITKEICYHFPEFIAQIVQTKYQTSNLRGKKEYDLAEKFLQFIDPKWFSPPNDNIEDDCDVATDMEIKINLSRNLLTYLPDKVLWELQGLTVLTVQDNFLKKIENSLNPSVLQNNSLTHLDFSSCKLTDVSSHLFELPCLKKLNLSHNQLTSLGADMDAEWKCRRLSFLNISNNMIMSIPTGIKNCFVLEYLIACYNEIRQPFPPWQCPIKVIELSYNKLTTFSPSADQFWGRSLQLLKLDHNCLDDLTESIVRMYKLVHLDVSYNSIRTLPAELIWTCQLNILNLNNNRLGLNLKKTPLQRTVSLNQDPHNNLEFPGSVLKNSLMELSLADNKLKEVPKGICCLENLSILDLSRNTEITSLPEELGNLKRLTFLKLKGIVLKDKQLQAMISEEENNTQDIISYLERKLKKCVPANQMKMIVLGCNNAGGQCLVEKLISGRGIFDDGKENNHQNLNISTWEFLPASSKLSTLFVQSCIHRPKIIVACLCPSDIDITSTEETLKNEAQQERLRCKFIFVNLEDSQTLSNLCQKIYEIYEDSSVDTELNFSRKQVPSLFVEVARKTVKMKKDTNICSLDEYLEGIGCSKQDLHENIYDGLKLHEHLLQVGAMLHYSIYREELSQCVFLNPSWLFSILNNFLKSLKRGKIIQTHMSIYEVKKIVTKSLNEEYFISFLQLLEAFNIGIRIVDSFKNEILLIPSLLPQQPPRIHLGPYEGGYRAVRLYCVPAIPSAFWSQVILQLVSAFDRFSSLQWNIESHMKHSNDDLKKSFKMGCRPSSKGLYILNKNIQYWRTGIMINHDQGYLVVEEVECLSSNSDKKGCSGILVTVQTTGNEEENSHMKNLKKLSVIGIIRDELEECLDIYFPKFHDSGEVEMKPYALCPHCYNDIQPFSGSIIIPEFHFCVRDCAQMVMWKDFVTCSKGPASLEILVPEFLFFELPEKLRLDSNHLQLLDGTLGQGIAGTVQKGRYNGKDVAVKIFHRPAIRPLSLQLTDTNHMYMNAVTSESEALSILKDRNETEQRKISNAFCDVRKEVNVLSKLKHKCIVEFLGVCVKPQLLLVMELAPLGSLRSVLKNACEHNPDERIISQMVFNWDLDLPIVNSCKIIYREGLKPDNILLMRHSNVRVTQLMSNSPDYGISEVWFHIQGFDWFIRSNFLSFKSLSISICIFFLCNAISCFILSACISASLLFFSASILIFSASILFCSARFSASILFCSARFSASILFCFARSILSLANFTSLSPVRPALLPCLRYVSHGSEVSSAILEFI